MYLLNDRQQEKMTLLVFGYETFSKQHKVSLSHGLLPHRLIRMTEQETNCRSTKAKKESESESERERERGRERERERERGRERESERARGIDRTL